MPKIDMKERIRLKLTGGGTTDIIIPLPPLPKSHMTIEINNTCNHDCLFCATRKMSRKKQNIDENLMTKILNDAYNEGVREVGYFTSGEPFLSKNLAKYIGQARDIGYRHIYITTNGVFATLERVKECVEAGLTSIRFSINAHNRETYKFIHGKDDFDTTIKNLKDISKYRNDNNLDFSLNTSTILTKYTVESEKALKNLIGSYVDDNIFMNVRNTCGLLSKTMEDLYIDKEWGFECIQPFNSIIITCEGYLTACCSERDNYLAIADLNKMSLREAWECETFVEFRKRFINRDLKGLLCDNCFNSKCEEVFPINKDFSTKTDFDSLNNDNEIEIRKNYCFVHNRFKGKNE